MSEFAFGCVFCLKKVSSLKNKSTADALKDLDLFQFLCKYLLNNCNENKIRFNFDSIEEGMLPICSKCTNRYKELAELYLEFQELETQIKAVVQEFRDFVFSSDYDYEGQQDGLKSSDFHQSFRSRVLQVNTSQAKVKHIKVEAIEPEELEMNTTNFMAMTMNAEYKIEPEPTEDNSSEDNFEETQPDNFSFLESNDDQMDREEEGFKSDILRRRDFQTEETDAYIIEPRRSLRNRDSEDSKPKLKTIPTNNPTKVTANKKVMPESDPGSMSSTDLDDVSTTSIKNTVSRLGRTIKKQKKYICPVETCGIDLKNNGRLRIHLRKHESSTPEKDKTLTCPVCRKLFAVQNNLNYHVFLHQLKKKDKDLFICEECDVRCISQETLDKHVSEIHQRDVVKFICTICGSKLKSKSGLDLHLKAHAGTKPQRHNPCKYCPEVFSHDCQLKQHMFLKHLEYAKIFTCTVCGHKCSTNSKLQSHLRTHSTDKTYECKICQEKFKSWIGLDSHNIQKHGKAHYSCTLCEKKFTTKTGLTAHNRVQHDQDKNRMIHECSMCDKKFDTKRKLEMHMLYHGDARNFICEVCGKDFKSPDGLRSHIKLHLDDSDKPFKCEMCQKAFSWRTHHKSHMKSHHGIDIKTKINESTSTITGSAPDSIIS